MITRTDLEMERFLEALTRGDPSRSEADRTAILEAERAEALDALLTSTGREP